ncbi:hypothetical protein MMC28_002007 [Mycoblastus sanguinarius]|nr:hypothetical protein [Mycoblastus sanguinarius]
MDDPLPPNPYKALNIPKDATLTAVKSAHRKLVLSCHPDKVQDESAKLEKAEQFHQVQQAYEILSDEHRRQRYDERVKIAERRHEADERGPPRRSSDTPYVSRSRPVYEMRDGRLYEERVPNSSQAYEEDVFAAKYAEGRPASRKYDERYTASSSSRRTSGRVQEEKKKAREYEEEDERRRKERARAEEASARDQRTRRRDKDRKKDSEAKSRTKFAYVDDDGSDSEVDDRYYSKRETTSKRRHEDVRKREREDLPRRSSKREEVHDYDLDRRVQGAQEYINKSRETVEIRPDLPRRPTRSRAASNLEARTPPPPSHPPVDNGRRSSGRGRGSRNPSPHRSSAKDKRTAEIVDPPSSRRPAMPAASSDPRGLKNTINPSASRKEPHRSVTYQPAQELRQPSMRRAETMPINQMRRGDPVPSKSSNLRNTMRTPSDSSDSSDSDSQMTEDIYPPPRTSPRQKSTKYQIYEDLDNVVVEPEEIRPRTREDSPKTRRSTDRPSNNPRVSSNARIPPMPRASSYAFADERPRISRKDSARAPPPLKTHQSARGSPHLYGEYSPSEDYKVKTSPKIYADEVRYAQPYVRRGSEDVDRDYAPNSSFKPRHRPTLERNEPVF